MNNINRVMEFLQISMGFSWKGLAVFLLPMLPNILFFKLRDPNTKIPTANNHFLLDIVEHGSQVIFAALLIFMVSRKESPLLSGYMVFIALFLIAYIGLWIAYFTIGVNFTMLILMAVIPAIYFILSEIWLHNLPAVVFTVIFGIAHVMITYLDYH